MTKFILLTFGFLGWAFFEMSGGTDFKPASQALAANETNHRNIILRLTSHDEPSSAVTVANKVKPVDTTPPGYGNNDVKRVALNLTAARSNSGVQNAAYVMNAAYVPVNVSGSSSNAASPAMLPSAVNSGETASGSNNVNGAADIRSVNGNRVNLRGGPGTNFGVVTKMGQGDMVEVIQDNGDGWVKLRPVDGGPEGWMADFLLARS
tara:strand:+ start:7637 stop:8257 length:621 start_codon:yes stop_codon:yes gene_type:complete